MHAYTSPIKVYFKLVLGQLHTTFKGSQMNFRMAVLKCDVRMH